FTNGNNQNDEEEDVEDSG
ncbi:hypothetical protein Tco_0230204, partial [Tanacetum coccineum]